MVMLRLCLDGSAHQTAELETLLPTLELEPVKGKDTAVLQDDGPVTFCLFDHSRRGQSTSAHGNWHW